MKQILAGCLIVLIIAIIGFGVAGFYAYRMAQPMLESAGTYVDRAREMTRLGDRVANQLPYEPPASGELTPAQVDRFLAVQSRVRDELGNRWQEIETKSAEIRKKTDNTRQLSFTEVTAVFSDLANIYIEGRRAQVNALNIHKFSDAEYAWVRRRVYESAGLQLVDAVDISAVEAWARNEAGRTSVQIPEMPRPEVPETNLRLVKPHVSKLKEWLPMAVLGL